MPGITCVEAAEVLDELADLAELAGDTFPARAFRRAARSVGKLDGPLSEALASGRIEALEGVGPGIVKRLRELSEGGAMRHLEELRAQLPKGLVEITRVPGLGPKRAVVLYKELGIDSVAKLREACERGRLLQVRGFGARSQQDILRGLAMLQEGGGRRLSLVEAHNLAETLQAALEPHASRIAWAGSLRRRRDTVGDLDFVAVPRGRAKLAQALLGQPGAEPLAQGERKVSVRLATGTQVDLRIVKAEEFGAALLYFTGSKAHNIKLRALAITKGWRLNEYGLFEVERPPRRGAKPPPKPAAKGASKPQEPKAEPRLGARIGGASEEEVFAKLGLPAIPPELREDTGEVEAALEGKLPRLVEERDLKGDLHTHSKRSDGMLEPEAWVRAAAKSGLAYVGLTDHSIGLPGWGLTGAQLLDHRQRVLELADRFAGKVKVFVGTEANILKDGDLDLPANELDRLDYVVAGVHGAFQMSRADMTRRLITAMRSGQVDILAHPTTRKIMGQRAPIEFDADQVFAVAAETNVSLELDCLPDRLDLNGELARRAKDLGCAFTIDSDCHDTPSRGLLRWGLDQARRGWLGAKDVRTTLPPAQALKAITRH